MARNPDLYIDIHVGEFATGAPIWTGTWRDFLAANGEADPAELAEAHAAIIAGRPYTFGGGAAATSTIVRRDPRLDPGRSSRVERACADLLTAATAASVEAARLNDDAQHAARTASAAMVDGDIDMARGNAERAARDAQRARAETEKAVRRQIIAVRIRAVAEEDAAGRRVGPVDRMLGEGNSIAEGYAISAESAARRAQASFETLRARLIARHAA